MNSPQLEQAMKARPGSVLGAILAQNTDDPQALEALYLRVLSRAPTDEERAICRQYIADLGDRREAFEDILWSLINSTEFISRR